MSDPTPNQTVAEMLEYGESAAHLLLENMDDDDCVAMVRDFTSLLADWQPNIGCYREDPVMLGLSCLSAAHLFKLAFTRAYLYTDKKVDAIEAIQKAFGDQS